jgi:hypothetical protein
MSLNTGEITEATRSVLKAYRKVNAQGEYVAVGSGKSLTQALADSKAGLAPLSKDRRFIYFYNPASGASRRVAFDMPGDYTMLVGGRYFVGRDSARIYAVDLTDADPQPFSSLAVPLIGPRQLHTFYDTEYLFEVHPSTSPTKPMKVEIFTLSEHQVTPVKSFEIGHLSRFTKEMVTLSVDAHRVEFRSLEDLELVKSIEVPQSFLSTHEIELVEGPFVAGRNHQSELEYFDILDSVLLKLPFNDMYVSNASGDRYWCFQTKNTIKQTCVYDRHEQRVCLTIADCPLTQFLDDGRLAALYPAYGVCVDVYDLETGKSTRHAPFRWIVFALPLVLLAWFAWASAWLIYSAREGGWAWADLALIFDTTFGLLLYGGASNHFEWLIFSSRLTPAFASVVGMAAGLLMVGAFWSTASDWRSASSLTAITNASWKLTPLIPMTLVWSALACWLNSAPNAINTRAAQISIVAFVSLAAILVALLCKVMNLLGWRLRSPESNGQVVSGKRRTSLLDLFVVIACVAVVITAAKPIFIPLPKLQLNLIVNWFWLPTLLATAATSMIVLMTVLHRSLFVAKIGCTFAALTWCDLIVQEVLLFSGVRSTFLGVLVDPDAINIVVAATLSVFACTIAYRLRSSKRLSRHVNPKI